MIKPQAVSNPHCPLASVTVQGSCSRCPCALSFAEGHPALSWPLLLPVAHLGRGAPGRGTPHHPRDELPSLRCLRWRLHRRRAASSRLHGERSRFAGHRSCAAPSSCLCFGDERPLTGVSVRREAPVVSRTTPAWPIISAAPRARPRNFTCTMCAEIAGGCFPGAMGK